MKTTLSFLCALLISCGGYVKVDQAGAATIQGGFLSSISGLAVKVKSPNGTQIAYSQTGYDGTSVANTTVGMLGTGWAVGKAAQTAQFNTANTTAQQANARVPLVTQPASVAPNTTVFPIVTQPAPAILPKIPLRFLPK